MSDWAERTLDKLEATAKRKAQVDPYTRVVEKRFSDGRVIWFDDTGRDLLYLFKNEHPLVGICLASHKHPFSRGERIAALILGLCMSFLSATIVEFIRQDCAPEVPGQEHIRQDCLASQDDNSFYASIGLGAAASVIGMINRSAAVCSCSRSDAFLDRPVARYVCEKVGRCCAFSGLMWAVGFLVVGIVLLVHYLGEDVDAGVFIANFFVSQGTSWVATDVGLLLLKFFWKRRTEVKEAEAVADFREYRILLAIEFQRRGNRWRGAVDPAADLEGGAACKGQGALADGATTTTTAADGTTATTPAAAADGTAPAGSPAADASAGLNGTNNGSAYVPQADSNGGLAAGLNGLKTVTNADGSVQYVDAQGNVFALPQTEAGALNGRLVVSPGPVAPPGTVYVDAHGHPLASLPQGAVVITVAAPISPVSPVGTSGQPELPGTASASASDAVPSERGTTEDGNIAVGFPSQQAP